MFNVLLTAAAISGWCCSLILIYTLSTKKREPEIRVTDMEGVLTQNTEHLERITKMLEEENQNWEDLVKDYLERSEQK